MDRYYPAPRTAPVALPTAREHGALVAGDYESARRAETTPLLALYFVGQTTIKMLPEGDLVGPGFPEVNGDKKHWREVEPWVWQAVGGDERMGARVEDGRVVAIAPEPYAFAIPSTRAPWWRSKSLLLPLLVVAGGVFALTALAWPIRAIARRAYRAPFPYQGARAKAHRIAPAASLLMLAYFGAWAGFMAWMLGSLDNTGDRQSRATHGSLPRRRDSTRGAGGSGLREPRALEPPLEVVLEGVGRAAAAVLARRTLVCGRHAVLQLRIHVLKKRSSP